MVSEDDKVAIFKTQHGDVAIRSASLTEDDNVIVVPTQHGNIAINPGTINEGDNVIVVNTQHGKVAVKGGGCCYTLGNVSIRDGGFTITKTITDSNGFNTLLSMEDECATSAKWGIVYGTMSVYVDDVWKFTIYGDGTAKYISAGYIHLSYDEPTEIKVVFEGEQCGIESLSGRHTLYTCYAYI